MERIRDVDISIPAMLIDKSEVLPDEEIERLISPTLGILKNKRNDCTVYVFLYYCLLNTISNKQSNSLNEYHLKLLKHTKLLYFVLIVDSYHILHLNIDHQQKLWHENVRRMVSSHDLFNYTFLFIEYFYISLQILHKVLPDSHIHIVFYSSHKIYAKHVLSQTD